MWKGHVNEEGFEQSPEECLGLKQAKMSLLDNVGHDVYQKNTEYVREVQESDGL